jgi:hypothetical protein
VHNLGITKIRLEPKIILNKQLAQIIKHIERNRERKTGNMG